MSEVRILINIARPAEQVWALLGGYDWLPRWLDIIESSTLAEGGRLRHLKTADGATIVERLLTFDDDQKQYTYALLEGPAPVTGYVGTMSAKDDGNGGTVACWSSIFFVQSANEAEVVGEFEAIYRTGLERLKAVVESSG
ncbi:MULTISPECIES: SRPBCC family protein [unclassified Pseudomonas]|uniref:SRPBCC family protein n=1 Tax=unclassified Pseudomonas TaxID=196821 RepID=UPI00159FF266|nr:MULTISPECIES: SRPBCC family protein [unclassified Pseudomonas]NVZ17574.1 SRPBCC family protein [Pseudomonas sp. IPO3775]NWA80380.1 SRPBCC family protein [Pseudomonas sp. C8002]